jgi:beta-glucosidase
LDPILQRADCGRTYRYYTNDVLAPFGHGLSYSNWTLTSTTKLPPTLPIGQPNTSTTVSVAVTNTGTVDSSEVVMAYLRPSQQVHANNNRVGSTQQQVATSKKLPLIKQLFAVRRMPVIAAGKAQLAVFEFQTSQLALTDPANGNTVLVPGHYQLEFTTGRAGDGETTSWELELTGNKAVLEAFPS